MKHLIISALAVIAIPCAASAQSYHPDAKEPGQQEEYGRLVREVTGKAPRHADSEMSWPEAEHEAPVKQAPRYVPKPVLAEEISESEFLNDAADFANEPHRVRVVDRSKYDEAFVPVTLANTIGLAEGSILIDTKARQLYFAMPGGQLRRYGVAVGKAGAAWHGTATVGRMAHWPDWHPTADIRKENRRLKARVAGGASNPLGARAIYLYQGGRDTLYRIHGTNAPASIGKFASHGCIRMINEDVIELYGMVARGATVTVR